MEVMAGSLCVPTAPNSTVLRGEGTINGPCLIYTIEESSEVLLISGGRLLKVFTAVVAGLLPRGQPPGMLPSGFTQKEYCVLRAGNP